MNQQQMTEEEWRMSKQRKMQKIVILQHFKRRNMKKNMIFFYICWS